ncbi:hypothetical protein TNCV_4930371 [Trichonephila clavipes]|nr:hypothetical protein TNCV_4930371 [Trichonephila clavipes]
MLDHLEDSIRRVIADIRPQMLEKVIENWTSRLDYIRASRVSPMPEIIFKIRIHETRLGRFDFMVVKKLEVKGVPVRPCSQYYETAFLSPGFISKRSHLKEKKKWSCEIGKGC